jgi:hypothetical protein
MKKTCLVLLIFAWGFQSHGQKINKKLQREIQEIVKGFDGQVGVFVKDLKIKQDRLF